MDRPEVEQREKPGLLTLVAILLVAATFISRAMHAEQPLVENYVGRQVPTAMVARNMERGSGFLRPQLDTGPFPNFFLTEPPIYQFAVLQLARVSGMELSASGRILSAFATAMAGLGLYSLVRRREGIGVATWSLAAFAAFPLTLRYGRSFQPDAMMLGGVVAGLACWDRFQVDRKAGWLVCGWCLLALGVATKITAAFVLVPLFLAIIPSRRYGQMVAASLVVAPALAWYGWAAHLLATGEGSRASADNRAIWLGAIGLGGIFRLETIENVGRFLLVRAFTPLGTLLAVGGLWYGWRRALGHDRLWWIWGFSGALVLAMLADKLHHEYYWLLIAPVVAVAVGRCLDRLILAERWAGVSVALVLLALCLFQARSTWTTPPEWRDLVPASRAMTDSIPRDSLVVSPEALLFAADRRGCRLEWSGPSARRAAGEWFAEHAIETPIDLLEHYRAMGAQYFADLGARVPDVRRELLHAEVRRRYKVIVDRPEVMIADLSVSEMHPHAN